MPDDQKSGIKAWSYEDQPREKLLSQGRKSLSNAELLAIIIGSGSKERSAVDLCRSILSEYQNDLSKISKQSIADLCTFKGIGQAKAISILAALELGRRQGELQIEERPKITSSHDCYTLLRSRMEDLGEEVFKVVYLNQGNNVIDVVTLSKGGITGTVVDSRVLFRQALERKAVALIIAHNHPSGNLKPSKADSILTQKLKEAGKFLEIKLLDHLIISESGYYSFADEGQL